MRTCASSLHQSARTTDLARGASKWLFGGADRLSLIGEDPNHLRPHRDVLAQLHGIDLVERVVGRVVEIEVAGAVLLQVEYRGFLVACYHDVRPTAGHDSRAGHAETSDGL